MTDGKGKRFLRIDMNQSLKDLIIERWGCTIGKKFVCCIQDAIAKGKDRAEVLDRLKKCLSDEIEKGEITDKEVENSVDGLHNYETMNQ